MKKLYKKTKILQKTIVIILFFWYTYYSDIITRKEREKMKLKKIKKLIEKLEANGFDIFYTKGNDADSIKVYEDKKQVIYINYNYSYIDIIEK